MRKRNIKSVAHWVIMSILLLFPVLMVGVSAFANDEQTVTVTETTQYQTNEVNSFDDFVDGNIYQIDLPTTVYDEYSQVDVEFTIDDVVYISVNDFGDTYIDLNNVSSFSYRYSGASLSDNTMLKIDYYFGGNTSLYYEDSIYEFNIIFVYNEDGFVGINDDYIGLLCSPSNYLGQVTIDVDIQNASYKQEVNNWANGFKNLPVNQWYGQLLNAIGVGQTENSVMNVIYVYPLYVLWVYILDIIVDCFLVIINFGHNALHRLGGDNE